MSNENELPPCGLYRTMAPLGEIPAGRLVYFHNHGNPGPGVYLPSRWVRNRAEFHAQGHTLKIPASEAESLFPLAAEGLYRVVSPFECCAKKCVRFEAESLVTLGYDGQGLPILLTPELVEGAVVIPEKGTRIDDERIANLRRLLIREPRSSPNTSHTVH